MFAKFANININGKVFRVPNNSFIISGHLFVGIKPSGCFLNMFFYSTTSRISVDEKDFIYPDLSLNKSIKNEESRNFLNDSFDGKPDTLPEESWKIHNPDDSDVESEDSVSDPVPVPDSPSSGETDVDKDKHQENRNENNHDDSSDEASKPSSVSDNSSVKSSEVEKSNHSEYLNLDPSLSIIVDSERLSSTAESTFNELVSQKSKYIVPDDNLGHFKAKIYAKNLSESRELYLIWSSRKELQRIFIKSIFKIISNINPLSELYLREISKLILSKSSNMSMPMISLDGISRNVLGKIVYGYSVGLHDLIYFIPTYWTSVQFHVVYNRDLSESKDKGVMRSRIYFRSKNGHDDVSLIELNSSLRSFKLESKPKFDADYSKHSLFSKSAILNCIMDLYDIRIDSSKGIGVTLANVSPSTRIGILERTTDGKTTFGDGFRVIETVMDDINYYLYSEDLSRVLASLLTLSETVSDSLPSPKDAHGVEMHRILQYVNTMIFEYVRSRIVSDSVDVEIVSIDFEIYIEKKVNTASSLQNKFREYVDKSLAVPSMPLHFLFYLIDGYDLAQWRDIMFYTALSGMTVNYKLLQYILPVLSESDKVNYLQYINDQSRLSSSYYETEFSIPEHRYRVASVSMRDIIIELFIRTFDSHDYDYFRMISKGQWVGSSAKSIELNIAVVNPLFSKYIIHDHDNVIMDMNYDLIMFDRHESRSSVPRYIRSQTRVTEKVPNIFKRLLPSDSSRSVLPDSSVVTSFYEE